MKKFLCFGPGLLFTEAHRVTPPHLTSSQLSSTHSNVEKVLCSPATTVVRALLLGHLLKHSCPV